MPIVAVVARGARSPTWRYHIHWHCALCVFGIATNHRLERYLLRWGRGRFERDLLVLAADSLRAAGINAVASCRRAFNARVCYGKSFVAGAEACVLGIPHCCKNVQDMKSASTARLAGYAQCAGAKAIVRSFGRAMRKVYYWFSLTAHANLRTSFLASR